MGERRIYPPEDAARFYARCAGEPYRPSNGTEGVFFEAMWCDGCRRDAAFRKHYETGGLVREQPAGCPILINVHAYDIGDPEYPKQWRYGPDGQPQCTAFIDKHAPRAAYRCKRTDDLFAPLPEVRHG